MATTKELDPLNQRSMNPLVPSNQIGDILVEQSVKRYWKAIEARRVKDAQKMFDWYFNKRDEIVGRVVQAMKKTFKADTVARMNLRTVNIVERVVAKLALVYKEPAERTLDGGLKTIVESDAQGKPIGTKTEQSPSDAVFQNLLKNSTIASKANEWHKLGKFFNTVLVEVVWREDKALKEGGKIDFVIHTPAYCGVEVNPSNYLQPRAFYYPTWATIAGRPEQVMIYWDDENHYLVDRLGNIYDPPDNPNRVNPYGVMPIAVLRFKEGSDFWGEGMWELVDGNEEVAIQLSNLGFVVILQGHGQAVAINMNLPASTVIGPDRPIVVDKVQGSTEMAPPSFEFKNAAPDIEGMKGFIDWLVKLIQSTSGLGASSFSLEAVVASGTSKEADSVDIQEIRESDMNILQAFERELFTRVRAVWNYNTKGAKISDDAQFDIRFGETKPRKSVDEKNKEREFGLKNKTMSRVDIILEDNPGMTRAQAEEKLAQIIAEERRIDDKFGIGEALDNMNGDTSGDQNKKPNDQSTIEPALNNAEPPSGGNPTQSKP